MLKLNIDTSKRDNVGDVVISGEVDEILNDLSVVAVGVLKSMAFSKENTTSEPSLSVCDFFYIFLSCCIEKVDKVNEEASDLLDELEDSANDHKFS